MCLEQIVSTNFWALWQRPWICLSLNDKHPLIVDHHLVQLYFVLCIKIMVTFISWETCQFENFNKIKQITNYRLKVWVTAEPVKIDRHCMKIMREELNMKKATLSLGPLVGEQKEHWKEICASGLHKLNTTSDLF